MRYLFFIEPLVERENPTWKSGWIDHFVKQISASLLAEGIPPENIACLVPTSLIAKAHKALPSSLVVSIDQTELVPRFGRSALEITTTWYKKNATKETTLDMALLVKERLGNFIPSCCITFSPAPYLNKAWPDVRILHMEYGIASRKPFPETVYFDPNGMFSDSTLARFSNEIYNFEPDDNDLELLNYVRENFCKFGTEQENPLDDIMADALSGFDSAVLLALQFSNFYAYDANAQFTDQYDLLVHTLASVPPNIAVVVCEHPEHQVLHPETLEYLRERYPNFIWNPLFRVIYGSSHYLMPYVQGVITVSSSVGLQALLWKKKLAILGDGHLTAVCDTHEVSRLVPLLGSAWTEQKDRILCWLLSRFHLPLEAILKSGRLAQYLRFIVKNDLGSFEKAAASVGLNAIKLKELYHSAWSSRPMSAYGAATSLESDNFYASVYVATDRESYNEINCRRQFLSQPGNNEVCLNFSLIRKNGNPSSIRFDPMNRTGILKIKEMTLLDANGVIFWQWGGGSLGISSCSGINFFEIDDGMLLICHGDDPQIELDIDFSLCTHSQHPLFFRARLEVLALSTAAQYFSKTENQKIEKNNQIISLHHSIAERDRQISSLNQSISKTEAKLNEILSSRSWRITAPIRNLNGKTHKVLKIIKGKTIYTYRKLPISPRKKQKIKNILFVVFGFAFQNSQTYKRWKEYRQIKSDWHPDLKNQSKKHSPTSHLEHPQDLKEADGVWEWEDHGIVSSRISMIKAKALSQVTPEPLSMISAGNNNLDSIAAAIKLPEPPEHPEVSIIIPVYNNLKLTLECLLSIAKHTDSHPSFEIIISDDASTDQTYHSISKIENLRIIRNDKNLGFIRNCNKALELAKGRYVLYLNNDVQVTKSWLENLYQTFNIYPSAGVVGPKFVYPSGHLQEAGASFNHDGTTKMVGLNDDPKKPRYNYIRRVDYVSGAALMMPTKLAKQLGGFSEDYLPCYCEDSDLCLRVMSAGYDIYFNPKSVVIHHLSKTTNALDSELKSRSVSTNVVKLSEKWADQFDKATSPRIIAFYLPQFHPIPENDHWWGNGFTEWKNVTKAKPNFIGHYQPRLPADLGFYDLRLSEIMQQQADLAKRYGVHGFCFYYYWFGGKRLLEQPIEQMLATDKPEMPFCLCWANENWTRRWDGQDQEILVAQSHSPEDDKAVINDLIRYFRDSRYIRIDDRPLILVYRVSLFPDFSATVACWREVCREQGIGEIYVAMVESMELTHANKHPSEFGCDASVEFPPQGMAEQATPSGTVINTEFAGSVADYRDIAVRYATRDFPGYTRFKGVMPGWDNTARRQNNGFCFEHASPGAFQAWMEETIEQTRQQHFGDEKLVFVNAWNEWAEGAYLEPDRRFGHTYLEAVKNATEAQRILYRKDKSNGN